MEVACRNILHYLKAEYIRKGGNFTFNARKVKIPSYSNYLKGNALGKIYSRGKIEKYSDRSSLKWYRTKF